VRSARSTTSQFGSSRRPLTLLIPQHGHPGGCVGILISGTSFRRLLSCWSTSVTCGESTLSISSKWSTPWPSLHISGGIVFYASSWTPQHTTRTSYTNTTPKPLGSLCFPGFSGYTGLEWLYSAHTSPLAIFEALIGTLLHPDFIGVKVM
jgi:hypothetical protein